MGDQQCFGSESCWSFSTSRNNRNENNNQMIVNFVDEDQSDNSNNNTMEDDGGAHLPLVAEELNKLSFKEREQVLEEIHGVMDTLDETPEFIEKGLLDLRQELAKVTRVRRKMYDKAVFIRPSIETDRQFLLMFLRADRYNAKRAALRICTYFENKVKLFGEEKIAKSITLEDLDKDDMESLRTGTVQILSRKDQSGRRILFTDLKNYAYKHWMNQARYIWYQIMTSLEDEQVQKDGIVNIICAVGLTGEMQQNLMDFIPHSHIFGWLPMRLSAIHLCFDDSRLNLIMSAIHLAVDKKLLPWFRSHKGSCLEIKYSLLTYGIQLETDEDNRIPRSIVASNIENRIEIEKKRKEEQMMSENGNDSKKAGQIVEYPSPRDVLLGRGRPYQDFPGNLHLTMLEEEYRDRYRQSKERLEKTMIAIELIQLIKDRGGRFLQRCPPDGWKIASDTLAREKISQALRVKARLSNNDDNPVHPYDTAAAGLNFAAAPMDNNSLPNNSLGQSSPKRMRYSEK